MQLEDNTKLEYTKDEYVLAYFCNGWHLGIVATVYESALSLSNNDYYIVFMEPVFNKQGDLIEAKTISHNLIKKIDQKVGGLLYG